MQPVGIFYLPLSRITPPFLQPIQRFAFCTWRPVSHYQFCEKSPTLCDKNPSLFATAPITFAEVHFFKTEEQDKFLSKRVGCF